MAIPTAKTAKEIVIEGLKKFNSNPSVELITRATDYWLEEIKIAIASKLEWNILESTKVIIPSIYNQRIADPTDFESIQDVTFYDGGTKGTMQSATSSGITLASGDGNDSHLGRPIFITSGDAKGESSRIISISGDVAGIAPNWGTTPINGDYMIADYDHQLKYVPKSSIWKTSTNGYPWYIAYYNGEFYLDSIPDKSTYAIVLDLTIKIQQLDLEDPKYTILLSEWRNALDAGIHWKVRDWIGDSQANKKFELFNNAIRDLAGQDSRKSPSDLFSTSAF